MLAGDQQVVVFAAGEIVDPCTAVEPVIPVAAFEQVVPISTDKTIVEVPSEVNVFRQSSVAGGELPIAVGAVDRDRGRGWGVGGNVADHRMDIVDQRGLTVDAVVARSPIV